MNLDYLNKVFKRLAFVIGVPICIALDFLTYLTVYPIKFIITGKEFDFSFMQALIDWKDGF